MRKTDLKWRTGVCLGREDCISLSPCWGVWANVGGQTSPCGQLCVRVRADGLGCGAGQGVVLPTNWVGGEASRENVWRERDG
jgi:hypothetical protein